jgi:hypothetical protein
MLARGFGLEDRSTSIAPFSTVHHQNQSAYRTLRRRGAGGATHVVPSEGMLRLLLCRVRRTAKHAHLVRYAQYQAIGLLGRKTGVAFASGLERFD